MKVDVDERIELVAAAIRALDDDLERTSVLAYAEAAWAAANGARENPWDGSADNLKKLEREKSRMTTEFDTLQRERDERRREEELADYGRRLAHAVEALRETNERIRHISSEHDEASAELQRMEVHPIVVRWSRSRAVAANLGIGFVFERFADWFQSGRSVHLGPMDALQAASDGFVGAVVAAWANTGITFERARELVMPIRFSNDEDRALVIQARNQRDVVKEIAARLSAARDRRAELLAEFPALATTEPATELVAR